MFTIFLQSLLQFPRALLSRYRRWLNKVSNLKIHQWFFSHWLVTWLLRLHYITGCGPVRANNTLWFSINSPGRAVPCYLRAGGLQKCWPVSSLIYSSYAKTGKCHSLPTATSTKPKLEMSEREHRARSENLPVAAVNAQGK